MDCSTLGFPVLQHLPELAQTIPLNKTSNLKKHKEGKNKNYRQETKNTLAISTPVDNLHQCQQTKYSNKKT